MLADAWMFEVFAFGTIWFWLVLAALTVFLFYCADNDSGLGATVAVLIAYALLHYFGQIDLCELAWNNKVTSLLCIAGYFMVGALWAVGKWWFFVMDQRREYDRSREKYCADHNLVRTDPIPEKLKADFQIYIAQCGQRYGFEVNTSVTSHKSRIYIWMAYWPWSAVWTLINDPVRRIFNNIYDLIRHRMQDISDHIWADTKQDLE